MGKKWYEPLIDKGMVPDCLIRMGIRSKLAAKISDESRGTEEDIQKRYDRLLDVLRESPITIEANSANEQHYELPAPFFEAVLGPWLKYSCGMWEGSERNLADSEESMLSLTCERSGIQDGQEVFDLGCGWGSLSFFISERYPNCRISALSNSSRQREYIEKKIREKRIKNIEVITAEIGSFDTDRKFDRIVSVEMMEHVRNHALLFEKIYGWLKNEGKLFVHVFGHSRFAYLFSVDDPSDWIGRYFFTGGLMPSADLLVDCCNALRLEKRWIVNGINYQKTCDAWLGTFDSGWRDIAGVFKSVYGNEYQMMRFRWRIFFMSCAELFGFNKGDEWQVYHYLFSKDIAKKENPAGSHGQK